MAKASTSRLCLLAAVLLGAASPADMRAVLSGLVGHTEAEVIHRLGPPSDTAPGIDSERLFYDTLDAGRLGDRSGDNTRAGGRDDRRNLSGTYDFYCRTEIVIADGLMRAFNRQGNDCH